MINVNHWAKNYLGLLIIGIVASTPSFADKGYKMKQNNSKIEALFKQTKPVCFGRFIINAPVTAVVSWGRHVLIIK
ncbi:hypothetical protein [Iodobacter ciconiae]|uniref:Uncharacterized protein n=1 Tax=Iodobacter ciconiae TaxID=2496266 RepID=A0A3S8ZRN7_9NEIS|nr:hypothetical protein [Iodobacter ciconiae]AZN36163.1 hypothetical protein EJO50_06525 [Iodobacter ciconiae]